MPPLNDKIRHLFKTWSLIIPRLMPKDSLKPNVKSIIQVNREDKGFRYGATSSEEWVTGLGVYGGAISSDLDFYAVSNWYSSNIYKVEATKLEKLQLYRKMADYYAVGTALEYIIDEAVNYDTNGNCMFLTVRNPKLRENKNLIANLQNEFKKLMFDIVDVNTNISDYFYEFLVCGELFFENEIDPSNYIKGIQASKYLPVELTYAVRDRITNEVIGFVQKDIRAKDIIHNIPRWLISYVDSGHYRQPMGSLGLAADANYEKDVLGYLEPAKIAYRQLQQMEDSLVIYRIIRAPERRVFNIDVGGLPKNAAEQYVKGLMRKYRQRNTYNSETGELQASIDPISVTEDFWFPKTKDGKGSTVTTLEGGKSLGEMEDVEYFLKRLYAALKIPYSKIAQSSNPYSLGLGTITRDEIRFSKYVKKIVNKFMNVFHEMYWIHLTLRGIIKQFDIKPSDLYIGMYESQMFVETKENEICKIRAENYGRLSGEIGENFSRTFLMKKYLKFSDDEINENEKMMKHEKGEPEEITEPGATLPSEQEPQVGELPPAEEEIAGEPEETAVEPEKQIGEFEY